MKKLILLITFITTSALANFLPESKINGQDANVAVYMKRSKCEAAFSEKCHKIPFGYSPEYHELVDEMVDDDTKPIYEAKSNVVTCSAVLDDPATTEIDETKTLEEDCMEKEAAHICDLANKYYTVRVADNSEVYCTRFIGFEQKASGNKIVAENAAKKSAFEASEVVRKAKESAIAMATKAINCGKRVIAMLVVQNASKGLDTTQIKAMNASYSTIKDLLETGSLTSAREEILAATADGVLVTETDKTVLVAELDLCKP